MQISVITISSNKDTNPGSVIYFPTLGLASGPRNPYSPTFPSSCFLRPSQVSHIVRYSEHARNCSILLFFISVFSHTIPSFTG